MSVRTRNQMPTAGRLVGAIIFGATGAGAAFVGIPTLPEEVLPGYLLPFAAVVGVWQGWSLMGPKAGGRMSLAITQGIATVAVMIVTVIFGVSAWDMVARSMKLRYDGPGEAVLDVANLMWFYGQLMNQPLVWAVLAAGAFIGSIIVNFAARIWK